MSKIRRGGHSAEGETLSAGRVEYLEAARARVRTRRIRRTVIIVAVLTILVLFATGMVGSSIARAKDLVDSVHIALTPASGWPQQTGITDPDTVVPMSGSFVEKGGDSCAVYSLSGTRLNSIQSGYARPAIAVGKNRFVLYNRSGNELRVESRTQNLYTKTMDSTIALCAVANAGQVAVVTDSTDSEADGVQLRHGAGAELEPDQRTGHAAAHGLFAGQPPPCGGGRDGHRRPADHEPLCAAPFPGRPGAIGHRSQRAPVDGLDVQRLSAGAL